MVNEKGSLKWVFLLLSLFLITILPIVSAGGAPEQIMGMISSLKPSQECSGGGMIYIHAANVSWDSIASKPCSIEERGEKVACNDKMCDTEGDYLYTFHADGAGKDHNTEGGMLGLITLASDAFVGDSDAGIVKTIPAPWGPVNYDLQEWSCKQCGGQGRSAVWDPTANGGNGVCCGDDSLGRNPSGDPASNIDDPDMGELSCTACPRGLFNETPELRQYKKGATSNGQDCCGDDIEDCAMVGNEGYICIDIKSSGSSESSDSVDPEDSEDLASSACPDPDDCDEDSLSGIASSGKWYWKSATKKGYAGIIIDSKCFTKRAFVSDGDQWIGCMSPDVAFGGSKFGEGVSNPLQPTTKLKHGFACLSEGTEEKVYQIAECCGKDSCLNDYENLNGDVRDWGGISKTSGDSVNINDKLYFCLDDFTFSESLKCSGTTDCSASCTSARYPNGTAISASWTGKGCCSKISTSPKFFNDKGNLGACYNGSYVKNDYLFTEELALIASNGTLLGCNLSGSPSMAYFDSLKDLDNSQLITNMPYCSVTGKGYYYCDIDNKWKLTEGKNMSYFAYMPSEWKNSSNAYYGCCEPGSCWSGNSCFTNQANLPIAEPFSPLAGSYYRCINGIWDNTPIKKGLDGNFGFCPSSNMCLVSISGNALDNAHPEKNPICINNTQYIQDNYCEAGNWSSRTKMIALSMLSTLAPDADYSLYCGPYAEVLNSYDYATFAAKAHVKSLFENKKLNNVCVLGYNEKVLVGFSINTNLTDKTLDIPGIFSGFKGCQEKDSTNYESCHKKTSDNAWYNKPQKSLIFANADFRFNVNPSLGQFFESFVRSPVSTILDKVFDTVYTDEVAYNFVDDLAFDQLYIRKKGQVRLMSVFHDGNIVAKYDGSSAELCNYISLYNQTYNKAYDGSSQIVCIPDSIAQVYSIYSTGSDLTSINPLKIWTDLSGKLRLS